MNIRDVIRMALKYQGAPYIWGGKGMTCPGWTNRFNVPVFDCSGLVTTAMEEAGGPNWRTTHNAQKMFNVLDEAGMPDTFGVLRFYGLDKDRVTHVAFSLGNGLILDAHGGGSSTTSLEEANKKGAKVQVHFCNRRDLVGARKMPQIPEAIA